MYNTLTSSDNHKRSNQTECDRDHDEDDQDDYPRPENKRHILTKPFVHFTFLRNTLVLQ